MSTSTRKPFVGGNWKCNGTKKSIEDLVALLNDTTVDVEKVDVVVAPTMVHLSTVQQSLKPEISVCAQNLSSTACGAYTGEVAASQLSDLGLSWVLAGHSERRTIFGEDDSVVSTKTLAALDAKLNVVLCIGETLEEREAETTMEVVSRQLKAVVDTIPSSHWENNSLVIAYEPVWAIGTGKVATPAQAQEVHAFLRQWISSNLSPSVSSAIRIIYGGSVKASNCSELINLPDVDGFLVGGASLKPEFSTIIASTL